LAVASDPRSFRDARMHPLLTTMAVALLVRWAGFFVTNEAEARAGYVPLMYAIPGLTALAMIWMLATNRSLEFPTTWSERAQDAIARLHDRTASLRLGWPRLRGDRA
jgi:lipopolysaccharide export system permease protein